MRVDLPKLPLIKKMTMGRSPVYGSNDWVLQGYCVVKQSFYVHSPSVARTIGMPSAKVLQYFEIPEDHLNDIVNSVIRGDEVSLTYYKIMYTR